MSSEKTIWQAKGSQILCNGNPAVLNGVCYSPTPHIYGTGTPNIGDWFHSECAVLWRSEYPDDRGDLARMKALGITHLRVYFWWEWQWPDNGKADAWVQNRGWRDADATRFDHQPFLDTCAKEGISVAIGLAVDGSNIWKCKAPAPGAGKPEEDAYKACTKSAAAYRDFYVDTAAEIGRKWGDHPAVMGLCVGNEQNQPPRMTSTAFWDDLGTMANAFRKNAPDKLTMIAFQNDANLFDYEVEGKSVPEVFSAAFDVYGLNIYGDPTASIQNFRAKVTEADGGAWTRPLIVSEWGVGGGKNVPDHDGGPASVILIGGAEHKIAPDEGPPYGNAIGREYTSEEFVAKVATLESYWQVMQSNADIVAGSEYFAWSDEWWKNETDPVVVAAYDNNNPRMTKDAWGRYKFPYFATEEAERGYSGGYEWRFLTRIDQQDGSASPDWPEEFWGLFSIAENPKGLPGWNEYGMYNPDVLTARPTAKKLGTCFKRGSRAQN